MNRKILIFLIIIITLSVCVSCLFSQEKLKLYIINEKLGKIIDLNERNLLGLYPEVSGFRYAAFFTRGDSTYGVKILYYEQGKRKFITRNYSKVEIQKLSDYINKKVSEVNIGMEKEIAVSAPEFGFLIETGERVDFEGNGIGYGLHLGMVGGDHLSLGAGYTRITFEGKNKVNAGLSIRTSFFPENVDEESFAGIGARINRTFAGKGNPGKDIDSGEVYIDFGCNIKISNNQIFYIKLSPAFEYILTKNVDDRTSGGVFINLGFIFH